MVEAFSCQDAVRRLDIICKGSRIEETPKGNSINKTVRAFTVNNLSLEILAHDDRDKVIKDDKTFKFLMDEFQERLSVTPINPGVAWKQEKDRWSQYLKYDKDEKVIGFSYSYSERMYNQLQVIKELFKNKPDTRQAYLSIWDSNKDVPMLEKDRVPCTIGYHFKKVDNEFRMLTIMRSWEMDYCVPNDIWLSSKLAEHVFEGKKSILEFYASVLQRFIKEA